MFRYSAFALPVLLFAGASSPAQAACVRDGDAVNCTDQDTNGYVSPSSGNLRLTVNPGATLYNLNNGETAGECDELALPSVWLGDGSAVTNGGTIVTQGVCGWDIALGDRGTVVNRGQIVSNGVLGVGILAGDRLSVTNAGGITTNDQSAYGILAGGSASIATETGSFILTRGGGASGIVLQATGVIDNQGRIETQDSAADGINAGAGLTLRNSGQILTRAAGASAIRSAGGDVTIVNSGEIGALFAGQTNAPAHAAGVLSDAANISLANTGTITGAFAGVQLNAAGAIILTNAGVMTATGERRNDGSLAAGGGVIVATSRSGATIANAGQIIAAGGQPAIRIGGGNVGLTNTGVITGDVLFGGGEDTLALSTGGRFTGTFDGGAGTDTLLFTGSGDFSAAIANVEMLSKSGPGTWTLHGALAFSRQANILDGVLKIDRDGTVATPALNIVTSGTLAGGGAVAGTVNNSGTLAPGAGAAAPVRLSILGAYVQDAAGTLVLNVSAAGGDSLYIGGTATLSGTLKVAYDPTLAASHFTGTRERRILFAADRGLSVSGDFARIVSNAAFIDTAVRTSPAGVDLLYSRISYGAAAATPNQRAAGEMLDRLADAPSPALAPVIAALDAGTPASAGGILAALTPETVPALQNLGLFTLQSLRDARPIPGDETYAAWGTALNRHGSAGRPGAAAFRYDLNGGAAGFSLKAGETLRLQALLARTSGDASFATPASGTLGGNFAGLGVDYRWDILTVSAGAIYGTSRPETRRTQMLPGTTSRLSARGDAALWSVYGRVDAPFDLGAITLTPGFALTRDSVSLSRFAETGALSATTLPSDTVSFRAEPGLRAEASVGGVRPYLGLRLAKELLSGQRKATAQITGVPGSDFTVSGQRTRGLALSLDGGLAASLAPSLAPGLEAHAGARFTANDVFAGRALTAGVTYRW